MTTYYIPVPEMHTTDQIRLDSFLDGLSHVFGVQKIAVIGIVTDDPRLDPLLCSLAKDVVCEQPAPVKQKVTSEEPASIVPPGDKGDIFLADWVIEEQPTGTQTGEASPTENKPAEGERACIMCGNPVPPGRRSPTCSQKCYMKNYWETHKGNGESAKPRKQRGAKKSQGSRAGYITASSS